MSAVFVSYSHKDKPWKERIVTHLGVLAQEGKLTLWEDSRIEAGNDWLPEIEQAIHACDVALLLISADFLTSKFILGSEIPPLLERRISQGVRVIPVILRPCAWTEVSWLGKIQARPAEGKALSSMPEYEAEQALADLVKEINRLHSRPAVYSQIQLQPETDPPPENIFLDKLPQADPTFLGREKEFELLDNAWAAPDRTHIVELVAPGGVGKTSLIKRWLDALKANHWRGARRVYGWSFYSQGTSDDRQASEDQFLENALKWFNVRCDPGIPAQDKAGLLANEIARERTLLVLDGVEPLQYAPGPLGGQLRAPGLQTLLCRLASTGHPGLCLVTTRETVQDLSEYERSGDNPDRAVVKHDLGNLSEADGAELLFRLGVRRCGAVAIKTSVHEELKKAAGEVAGHALTLRLLGGYLALAHEGDILQRDIVDYAQADEQYKINPVDLDKPHGHAFKVIGAYEKWFDSSGRDGARNRAVFRLLGFFDRPAGERCLAVLRQPPAIAGLTEPLIDISEREWTITLRRLADCRLVTVHTDEAGIANQQTVIDAHPLVREYFAKQLSEKNKAAWKEGHRRLYEHLATSTKDKPKPTLEELQPLYQAVVHGCKAGLQQEACEKVYHDRILKGTGPAGNYSTNKLGAFGVDLGAVACFFEEPWKKLSSALSEADQAWLLNEAAFRLRALGRLSEAVEPMRAGLENFIKQGYWKQAAGMASNLSELELTLGSLDAAIRDARQSVEFADKSGDAFLRMGLRTTLADALHQSGQRAEALTLFREAEVMQAERQPEYPLLYSLQGFQYCDLLLAGAERSAWQRVCTCEGRTGNDGGEGKEEERNGCREVEKRAGQTLEWIASSNWLLDIALDHLTLGRAGLSLWLLNPTGPALHQSAIDNINAAVNGLRAAGAQEFIVRGLLTRSLLHFLQNAPSDSRADLDEAQQVAERGRMLLHLADVHLHRGRLFGDKAELAKARAIIEKCGYWRRKEELEAAENTIA